VLAVHPGVRLVGIDESEPMLALARDRFPTEDLRVQRLEDPLPEGSYDLVVRRGCWP
jgi:SAM-dependent methyltransferase